MNLSIRSGLILLLCCLFNSIAIAADLPRTVVDLDPGWKFIRQDVPGAEQIATDDSTWQSVDLPHTWNSQDGEDGGNNYYRGIGWYRLHLKAQTPMPNMETYLKFDAACMDASVYVNGKLAGTHGGGFSAFCFDITPLLNQPGENVIAVKVSNAKDLNVTPLSGDFTMFGGIYRNVHLIMTPKLSISPIDDAASGVYAKQVKVDADSADLEISTTIRNAGKSDKAFTIKCDVVDAGGNTAGTASLIAPPLPAGAAVSAHLALTIPHPHLWNGRKDPYLYTLRATLMDGTDAADEVDQPIGLRFFRVDPDQGFFLNGQPYRLLGVNRHQDRLDKGWAISLADHQSDYADMMEMGCTAVRLSHYQHAQEFYDLCDHGGIVAWAELPMINQVNITKEFDNNAAQQLRELIKQSFNHPAICFWSLSNELGGGGPKGVTAAQEKQHQIELITQLNSEAKQMDPTRLTTQASAMKPGMPKDAITDLIGFNRYHGWYSGKPDGLGPDLDKLHSIYPNRGVSLSEYGGGSAVTQHEPNVKQPKANSHWHPEEWQALIHEQAWAALKPRTWVWGTFIWCEHDFASDGRNEGDHSGRNDKGMVTYDGKIKKDVFYFYKANWSTEPTVYITDRRFSPRAVADLPVKVYSNCDSVELSVNGKSLGTATGSDIKVFNWNQVLLQTGENKLEAVGTRDGKSFTDTCTIIVDPHAADGHPPATMPSTR